MIIRSVTLYYTKMPLVSPFQTSYGLYKERESILIQLHDEEGRSGWGEVVAFSQPWYTEETIVTSSHMLIDYLIPAILHTPLSHPSDVRKLWQIKRNHMAKAGLEGALWDLYAKRTNQSLASALGGSKEEIEVGVVIGLDTLQVMLRHIEQYARDGYKRFKVKIKSDRDYEIISTIRREFPQLPLMVDANSAYTLQDIDKLKRLDEFGLLMIEQPLGAHDFLDHAELQQQIQTPICLDESIHTLEDARVAIQLGSCRIINVKAGRVGGLTEAIHIHHYCMQHNIPIWCGGMIETGISRAQNVALSTLPNFTIPGDISASSRHWEQDIITPQVTVRNGKVTVPKIPGIGYHINYKRLEQITMHTCCFT